MAILDDRLFIVGVSFEVLLVSVNKPCGFSLNLLTLDDPAPNLLNSRSVPRLRTLDQSIDVLKGL